MLDRHVLLESLILCVLSHTSSRDFVCGAGQLTRSEPSNAPAFAAREGHSWRAPYNPTGQVVCPILSREERLFVAFSCASGGKLPFRQLP
jgi:hypothetical protein